MIKPFTIQIPVDLIERVKNWKSASGKPIQRIISEAIAEYLKKNGY
jgi:predicted DNA binding CopG/RHH family protein